MTFNHHALHWMLAVSAVSGTNFVYAQSAAVPEQTSAVQSNDRGKIVGQMLSARYERRPTIALFDVATEADPARRLVNSVAMGNWNAVASELVSLSPDDAARVHLRMISSLAETVGRSERGAAASASLLTPADVIELADCLPNKATFTTPHLVLLGKLLEKSSSSGEVQEEILNLLRTGTKRLGGNDPERRQQTAVMLAAAGQAASAWEFFGDEKLALQGNDPARAELFVRTIISVSDAATDRPLIKRDRLVATIGLLGASAESSPAGSVVRRQYISLAIRIAAARSAPLLLDDWINHVLAGDPALGREVLIAAAAPYADDVNSVAWQQRAGRIAVQKYVVERWIESVDREKDSLPPTFYDALLENFCLEASLSAAPPAQRGSDMQRGSMASPPPNSPQARGPEVIPSDELISNAPTDKWLSHLSPAAAARARLLLIDLQLRLDQIDKAVALLESPPQLRKEQAQLAAGNILAGWTKLHDRTVEKGMPGGTARSIALTTSDAARQRNLAQLSQLSQRLRKACEGTLPSEPLIKALIATQGRVALLSQTDVESVFGPVDKLDADTIVQLTSALRRSLQQSIRVMKTTSGGGNAPDPSLHRGGFELIEKLLQSASASSKDWRLAMNLGVAQFEYAEFSRAVIKDTAGWLKHRKAAFDSLQMAAARFAEITTDQGTAQIDAALYTQWFFCAMGESDPIQISGDSVPDMAQLPLITQSIRSLPSGVSREMMAQLARALSAQAARTKPEVAQAFALAAVSVVGDIPAAEPLARSLDYYRDILSDLKLISSLDGDASVGVDKPFGVTISIQYTQQLDREVDGFTKLIQAAQSPPQMFAGVPQASGLRGRFNYRERFERDIRRAAGDKLEVLNILWADPASQSSVAIGNGWQQLPLVYVLLKAKDASIDLFASTQLILDFGDRGAEYVLLPVVSAPIALDVRQSSERPMSVAEISQTLNDREAAQGKMSLEIVAKGTGMVPKIEQLLDLSDLGEFEVGSIIEQELLPDWFGPAVGSEKAGAADSVIHVQRACNITLKPRSVKAGIFRFPTVASGLKLPSQPAIKLLRYSDTDIVSASSVVNVSADGFSGSRKTLYAVLVAALIGVVAVAWLIVRLRRKPQSQVQPSHHLPQNLTLFSVVGYLRSIREDVARQGGASALGELDATAHELEESYCGWLIGSYVGSAFKSS